MCNKKRDNRYLLGGTLHGITPGVAFKTIGLGEYYASGIDSNDKIVFWGFPGIDDGREMPPKGKFTEIAVGTTHACGIRESDKKLLCWGNDEFGKATPPE